MEQYRAINGTYSIPSDVPLSPSASQVAGGKINSVEQAEKPTVDQTSSDTTTDQLTVSGSELVIADVEDSLVRCATIKEEGTVGESASAEEKCEPAEEKTGGECVPVEERTTGECIPVEEGVPIEEIRECDGKREDKQELEVGVAPDTATRTAEVTLMKEDSEKSSKESSPMSSLDSVSTTSTSSTKETSPDSVQQENLSEDTPQTVEKMEVDASVMDPTEGSKVVTNELEGISKCTVDGSVVEGSKVTSGEGSEDRGSESTVIVYTPGGEKEQKISVVQNVGGDDKAETESKAQPKFMFNIADGGFTELHSLWAEEKTKGFSFQTWGRHHDYWLLKGLVTYPCSILCRFL